MSHFQPTKRNVSCPVCGDTKGSCRETEKGDWLCMTYADAKKFEIIEGFKCVGHTSDGLWAIFIDVDFDTYQENQKYDPELIASREIKKAEKARQEKENTDLQIAKSLSSQERHEQYTRLLSELSLHPEDIADLKRRGLSDAEIELAGFKSVVKFQKMKGSYHEALPCINKANQIIWNNNGYLCPVRDYQGFITGLQIRLRNPTNTGRYRWISSVENSVKLPVTDAKGDKQLELPLAVFKPSQPPIGIAIVEGVGVKSFFVSQRLNYLVIGAAGGLWLKSPVQLIKIIQKAFEEYGVLPITIFPDSGFTTNYQVKSKLENIITWLKELDFETLVADWNQITKKQYDIDEIKSDISHIRYLNSEAFLLKYKECFTSGKRFENWAKKRKTLTADIKQHEPWLTIPKGIENNCDILMIRKGLGGGKTQALIEYSKGIKPVTILVGYRNTLTYQSISRANNSGLSAKHIKDYIEIHNHTVCDFTYDSNIKLWGGCVDSFEKLEKVIKNNPEYHVAQDEICSVLKHLKDAGTLKTRQKKAIEWNTTAIENSKFCIMMDANLSDKEVSFVKHLFPNKRVKVLDSNHESEPRTFYFVETSGDKKEYSRDARYLPSALIDRARKLKKVLWISDSQRSCEIADEILTKSGQKHFRLDGKTSNESTSKLFLENPKEFIISENIDSVSISPSAESGLSIDLFDHFEAVLFDIKGTVDVNSLIQLSSRLRDTKVPIYVSCPEFVNTTENNCPYALNTVNEVIQERVEMMIAQACKSDENIINGKYIKDMFDKMGEEASKDLWFIESLKDSKNRVYEHQNLKISLKTALAQNGNKIIDWMALRNEQTKEEVKETKEKVLHREAEKIFFSAEIDIETARELSKKDVNYENKCSIRKAFLKERLPGIEKTESWNADFIYTVLLKETKFLDGSWKLEQLEDEQLGLSIFKLENQYKFEHGFQAMDIWRNRNSKIEALKMLGIQEIINAESFSVKKDFVRDLVDKYYDNPSWFNLIGITKAKKSEEQPDKHIKTMINKFLDFFGLKTEQVGKNNGERFYKVSVPEEIEPYLRDIMNCYKSRIEKVISEASEISLTKNANLSEAEKFLAKF